jgi:hypothetical protein
MEVAERALSRYFVDVLAELNNGARVVVRFTAGRLGGCGRLRVVRVTGDDSGTVSLTVAAEGWEDGRTGVPRQG